MWTFKQSHKFFFQDLRKYKDWQNPGQIVAIQNASKYLSKLLGFAKCTERFINGNDKTSAKP